MKGDIDPRLVEKIEHAGDDGEVEAVLLLAEGPEVLGVSETDGSGQRLVQQVCDDVQQRPLEVRYLPRLGAMYIKGSGKLIRQLLDNDLVVAASSNEGEFNAV